MGPLDDLSAYRRSCALITCMAKIWVMHFVYLQFPLLLLGISMWSLSTMIASRCIRQHSPLSLCLSEQMVFYGLNFRKLLGTFIWFHKTIKSFRKYKKLSLTFITTSIFTKLSWKCCNFSFFKNKKKIHCGFFKLSFSHVTFSTLLSH